MTRAASILRQFAAVLGVGAVLFFFSEFYFYNEMVAGPVVGADYSGALTILAEMMVYYSWCAIPFLAAISWARPQHLAGVFLAGCFYGWAIEGAVIPVVYEAPPFSLFWTSVSWHAVIDIMIGMVALPIALAAKRWWIAPLTCITLGLAWGYFATWAWAELVPLKPEQFTLMVLRSMPLLVVGLALMSFAGPTATILNHRIGLILSVLLIPFAILMAAATPIWGVALALLVALTLWTLAKGRTPDARPTPAIRPAPLSMRWLWLGLIPAGAITTYNALYTAGPENIPVADWIPPIMMFGGMFVFVWAIVKTLRGAGSAQPISA